MAKKKAAATEKSPPKNQGEVIERYEELFGEINRFVSVIGDAEQDLQEAEAEMAEAKTAYDLAKEVVTDLRSVRDGAKHGLFRYLRPSSGGEVLPLFDRMEPADEEVHGVHAKEWRMDPITALRLSLPSLNSLSDAEIMFVGQLQDRVLAKPEDWWQEIVGLTLGSAAAIVDRLNDFIFERTAK